MIKHIKQIEFPYWFNKRLSLDLYWHYSYESNTNKYLKLTIRELHRLDKETRIRYQDNEWYSSWWKHIKLWKCNN
jgi:hypothetical protein